MYLRKSVVSKPGITKQKVVKALRRSFPSQPCPAILVPCAGGRGAVVVMAYQLMLLSNLCNGGLEGSHSPKLAPYQHSHCHLCGSWWGDVTAQLRQCGMNFKVVRDRQSLILEDSIGRNQDQDQHCSLASYLESSFNLRPTCSGHLLAKSLESLSCGEP